MDYNSILVVVDWFMKMVHFVPTTEKTMAEELAQLFRDNVWQLHRLPASIISNRGPQFTPGLMKELNEMLGICYNLITQVATLALRLEDGLRVRGKGMHNILSVRRYSVSTGAYILIVVQELGLQ